MTQSAAVFAGAAVIQVDLPAADTDTLPGVPWGAIEAFPSPAYWTYQVIARRVCGTPTRHRLGASLAEEVGACLLGGHGIPANVGLAAFRMLQSLGAFAGAPTESELFELLSKPLNVDGRQIRYRFARQKARYLSKALGRLAIEKPPLSSGRALRDWLMQLPGIGFKTASWVARNWMDADDVAILDIHILRAGALARFFDENLTVERNYLQLEAQFLRFAEAIGVRPSELDAVMWFEMMSSPRTITQLMGGNRSGVRPQLSAERSAARSPSGRGRSHKSRADTHQARLID
jgi:N-glycosylase/DNA lyase